MKTILMCSNAYPPNFIGGAELVAHRHAKVLRQNGYRVVVFAGSSLPIGERHSMREETYEGLPVFRVHLKVIDYQYDYINFSHPKIEAHFDQLMERFQPDVVHMHNLTGLSTGIISRAGDRGAKTVLTVHDHWVFCCKNTRIFVDGSICEDFTRCAECLPYVNDGAFRAIPIRMRNDFVMMQARRADCIVSPSEYLAGAYIEAGISPSRMRVVGYGVDIERFSRIQKSPHHGRLRFTYIGILRQHKGVHVIVEALQLLSSRGRSVGVNLVGEGDMEPMLRREVAKAGLSSCVHFAGKVENNGIDEVFANTDVLVLPSVWPENQPVTILEAMACRTPVIASRAGGIPELVRDGITGYLFDPGDAADLARAMERFIEHPERLQSMGQNAFEAIESASIDDQVRELIRIYDE